jgi:hypothetical protein
MFCAPRHVFGGAKGVGSLFHVMRSRTHFRWSRGRRVPFSCFALPSTFSAVRRALGPVFMFCALGLVFGGIEGVGSPFHVLHARNHFRRYRGRRVWFSCFALPDSFSAVPRAWGPVFMFCAPGLFFGGTDGVGSSFHILRSRTHFWRYRGCRFRFHVLRGRTHFRRYQGRQIPFSCFLLPDSFFDIPKASGPMFMFCAPGLIFGDTEGVKSRFHVLCSETSFWQCEERRLLF